MKKVALLSMLAFTLCFTVKAANADLFQLDETKINTEMTQLNQLEDFVASNNGVTLTNLLESNDPSVANMNLTEFTGSLGSLLEPPLGIPSFAWGACFGVVGIIIVHFVAEDKEETKKALKGCAIVQGAAILLYIIFVVLIFGAAASTTV